MRTRSATRVIAVIASAGFAFAGVADAATTPKITINGPQGDFNGKIKKAGSCRDDRTVKVFKLKRDGKKRIATDTTDSAGAWSVGNTGYKNGRFYARAVRQDDCKSLTSRTIRLLDGVVQ